MAEVAANLLVKVGADIADAQKKLGTMGSTISDFGKSAMKAGGLMTAGLTLPIVALGAKAVGAASDLSESMSKVGVVFGENATQIEDWSMTAAQALGITRQQALESAGTFGNLFSAMGIGQAATADMSTGLVQLASDLASFNNLDPTEVLDKLRAGIVGEAEPLRTLGVNLSAAATEAYALTHGLAATKEEITPAIKAQANYALILEQTTLAQGDYARTADGLANSQRSLSAQVSDLTANLGTVLLPIVTQVVGIVTQAVTWFGNLDPTVQTIIIAVAALAAAAGPLVTVLGAVGVAIGALASPNGIVVAAIAALAAAWVSDFGGIRTTVTAFWEQNLKPIFETLVTWLQDNIPVALAALADYWENTLQPAIEVVWSFLQDNVFPILEALVNIYIAAAKAELTALAAIWVNVLQPALSAVWSFLQQYIIPIIVALVEVNIASLKLALTALAALWVNVLKPAIDTVWGILQNNIIPTFVDLKAKLDGPVTNALNAISRVFGTVAGAIGALSGVIQGVIGWLGSLIDKANAALAVLAKLGGGGRGAEAGGLINEGTGNIAGVGSSLASDAKAIADALAALVNAFTAVAQYSGSKIGPQLNRLMDQLHGAIYKLDKLAAILKRDGLDAAVVLVEAGGKIGRALTELVNGFVSVAGYAPQVIGPKLNTLFDQLHGLIFKISKLAGLFEQD
ncbi:MAG: hypothetical protein KDD75_19425, partial [Caldilineaceae bacterium]|nr:hypothetical protein [Caldilineaceae bacterium]